MLTKIITLVFFLNKFHVGWWKYGQKEGSGTYFFASTGLKFSGLWKDSKFVQGKWIMPNGNYYEGKFANNKPEGKLK